MPRVERYDITASTIGSVGGVGHVFSQVARGSGVAQASGGGSASVSIDRMGAEMSSVSSGRGCSVIQSGGGRVVVNGRSFAGRSVNVVNGKIYVDGKPVEEGGGEIPSDEREITVIVEGGCDSIDLGVGRVEVRGDARSVKTAAGDVRVAGSVSGGVTTQSGDVEVGGNVGGNARSMSGDVIAEGTIRGSASSMSGNVRAAGRPKRRRIVRDEDDNEE